MKRFFIFSIFVTLFFMFSPSFSEAANVIRGPYYMEGHAPNPTVEYLDRQRTFRNNYKQWIEDYYENTEDYQEIEAVQTTQYIYSYEYIYETGLYKIFVKSENPDGTIYISSDFLNQQEFEAFIDLVNLERNNFYRIYNLSPEKINNYKNVIYLLLSDNFRIINYDNYSILIYIG